MANSSEDRESLSNDYKPAKDWRIKLLEHPIKYCDVQPKHGCKTVRHEPRQQFRVSWTNKGRKETQRLSCYDHAVTFARNHKLRMPKGTKRPCEFGMVTCHDERPCRTHRRLHEGDTAKLLLRELMMQGRIAPSWRNMGEVPRDGTLVLVFLEQLPSAGQWHGRIVPACFSNDGPGLERGIIYGEFQSTPKPLCWLPFPAPPKEIP